MNYITIIIIQYTRRGQSHYRQTVPPYALFSHTPVNATRKGQFKSTFCDYWPAFRDMLVQLKLKLKKKRVILCLALM